MILLDGIFVNIDAGILVILGIVVFRFIWTLLLNGAANLTNKVFLPEHLTIPVQSGRLQLK